MAFYCHSNINGLSLAFWTQETHSYLNVYCTTDNKELYVALTPFSQANARRHIYNKAHTLRHTHAGKLHTRRHAYAGTFTRKHKETKAHTRRDAHTATYAQVYIRMAERYSKPLKPFKTCQQAWDTNSHHENAIVSSKTKVENQFWLK